jgi:hypothetical protein
LDLNVVRTFWHGSDLSVWEHISLRSFLDVGHEVEVYAYDDVSVPAGVKLCDAEEILPRRNAFSYREGWAKGSFAACSNQFRYALLHQKGGIWADTDIICQKSLMDLPDATIGWENHDSVNGAILKFSAGHPATAELFERASTLGNDIVLGQAGPWLLTALVQEGRQVLNILPIRAFYPFHWSEAWKLVDPERVTECMAETADSYCVHWWNGALRSLGCSRDHRPPEHSFLGLHAQRLLGATDAPVITPRDPQITVDAFAEHLEPFAEECRLDVLELEKILARLDEKCSIFGEKLNISLANRLAWWRQRLSVRD